MATQLPTPSPSPPPPAITPTLPTQINAASRRQHTRLNKLIIDRLPLALPPNASNPALYGLGLAAFAHIFYAFEAEWDILAAAVDDNASVDEGHDGEIRSWLATLRPQGLSRSQRLRDDIAHIRLHKGEPVSVRPHLQQELFMRMRDEIQAKPHLLIAYGWVMYMAIFSGGRWIRQQLSNAGPKFWIGQVNSAEHDQYGSSPLEVSGFSFLSFDGIEDGENIKSLFKARLAEAETLLSQQERQEVIHAAIGLFEDCIALVGMLDREARWRRIWSIVPVKSICLVGLMFALYLYR